MHAALGDDQPVVRRPRDELELLAAIDRERREIAGVDPDHLRVELHGALQLVGVVRLDERVHAELLCVREQPRHRRVVEVAQNQQDRVGACLAQFAQLLCR